MITYNTKTEVTQKQYSELRKLAAGICAFREESGKYFIKLLLPDYKKEVELIIKNS